MANPAWFDEEYYLESKLIVLENEDPGSFWSTYSIEQSMSDAGMAPYEHFLQFGLEERTNPNSMFNASEYLEAKLQQLQSTGEHADISTIDEVAQAIEDAGMSLWEHFQQFGWKEGINPSNAFDIDSYFESKLASLEEEDPEGEWTLQTIADAFDEAELDPISHYMEFGINEPGVHISEVPDDNKVNMDSLSDEFISLKLTPNNWSSSNNNIAFRMEFNSQISLDDISLIGNGSTTMSRQSSTVNDLTIDNINLMALNGQTSGSIEMDFHVPSDMDGSSVVEFSDFLINGDSYPDQSIDLYNPIDIVF